MQAVRERTPQSHKLIVFPGRMGTLPQIPPAPEGSHPNNPPAPKRNMIGIAAICIAAVAMIGTVGNFYVGCSNRKDQKNATLEKKTSETFNKDVNTLIDARLNPAVSDINQNITKQLAPITTDLSALKIDMAALKAAMAQLNTDLNRSTKFQLDKLAQQITMARNSGRVGNENDLRQIGYDLFALSAANEGKNSTRAAQVANELLGYYSFSIQADSFVKEMETHGFLLRGATREQECISGNPLWHQPHILIRTAIWENCTIHLDDTLAHTVIFENNLFKNVTVVYAGGHVVLRNVAFVDCTFQLATNEPSRKLGETLLAAAHVEHFETP